MAQAAFILLLADDDPAVEELRDLLKNAHGHVCSVVTSVPAALESIRAKAPDVVVIRSQPTVSASVTALVSLLENVAADATLIVVGTDAAPSSVRVQVRTLSTTTPPAQLAQRIATEAAKAVARREDRLLRDTISRQDYEVFAGIVGVSPPMRKIVERIRKVAPNKLTVLILGETGTGKDLIARAIHAHSDRAAKPFIPLNCAGLTESLLESQLFGHVKGAFTGATSDRKGYFEAAEGGTLFLDEIGDMPRNMQAKLLRALQDREITPVGSTEVRRVDVRLIAATNADLSKLVEEGPFREDLFYRLNQWVIRIPPLRERREDIPILADHFRRDANKNHGMSCEGISSEAMAHLTKYAWPGNVRELANLIETLVVEVEDRQIEAADLPETIRGTRDLVPMSAAIAGLTLAQVERLMIERTLQMTGGNREQAAKSLGIGIRTLYRKIKEYGL